MDWDRVELEEGMGGIMSTSARLYAVGTLNGSDGMGYDGRFCDPAIETGVARAMTDGNVEM